MPWSGLQIGMGIPIIRIPHLKILWDQRRVYIAFFGVVHGEAMILRVALRIDLEILPISPMISSASGAPSLNNPSQNDSHLIRYCPHAEHFDLDQERTLGFPRRGFLCVYTLCHCEWRRGATKQSPHNKLKSYKLGIASQTALAKTARNDI